MISNVDSPGLCSISPACEALLRASSASALVGKRMLPSLLINSDRGAHEPEWALSALLAAMEIGNNSARTADAIAVSSAFPQVHGTPESGCLDCTALKPAETCCSVAPMPVSWSTT